MYYLGGGVLQAKGSLGWKPSCPCYQQTIGINPTIFFFFKVMLLSMLLQAPRLVPLTLRLEPWPLCPLPKLLQCLSGVPAGKRCTTWKAGWAKDISPLEFGVCNQGEQSFANALFVEHAPHVCLEVRKGGRLLTGAESAIRHFVWTSFPWWSKLLASNYSTQSLD